MSCSPRRLIDLAVGWVAASVLSGVPSTVHALLARRDVTEATRAAGAMLVSADAPLHRWLPAAALVHGAVSLFWAAILWRTLPRSHPLLAASVAAAAIGVLDLRVIAPRRYPHVARLPFWPQMADHLMWGLSLGVVLARRWRHAPHRARAPVQPSWTGRGSVERKAAVIT
jgi:hypothetical protein